MKSGSDNFREAAILDIFKMLKKEKLNIVIYEPSMDVDSYEGCKVMHNLLDFKQKSDLILANRYASELDDVQAKVYTRDIFRRN